MGLLRFPSMSHSGSRTIDKSFSVRLELEPLEDRTLPSASMFQSMMTPSPQPSAPTMASNANFVASLSHDQIHMLQDQAQQQATIATITLEVEQFVRSILQPFTSQIPQLQPLVTSLSSAIPMQEATAAKLQSQFNLLNQLDDLQDQVILLNAQIQNDTMLVPILQSMGNIQAANGLLNTIAQDQVAIQALQPQITAVEQEVAAFIS